MKHDLRIIGYITSAIFILLWINQLFSGIKLYENEKTQWKIHVDSIIDNNIKALSLSDIHPAPVPTFVQLDSLLHGSTHYPVHFVIQQIDSSGLELFHYSRNRENTAKMIHAKAYPIANTPGEVLLVHYNFPFAYLLEKSWQDMLAIVALTLLLVFGLLYLSHAQQHLSRLQEQMIKQVVHDWKTPL